MERPLQSYLLHKSFPSPAWMADGSSLLCGSAGTGSLIALKRPREVGVKLPFYKYPFQTCLLLSF